MNRVKMIYCDTAFTPDQGVTSGSQSHPANFNHTNLAQAGATARQALMALQNAAFDMRKWASTMPREKAVAFYASTLAFGLFDDRVLGL